MITKRDRNGRIAKIHGFTSPRYRREFAIWKTMWFRCTNPKCERYENYGGRGILVCRRWQDFKNFLKDMGKCPSAHHSLGRKDNDGNYEPENCHWETRVEQGRNKRNNRLIEYNGAVHPVAAWAEITGINAQALYKRLNNGWDHKRTIETPIQ